MLPRQAGEPRAPFDKWHPRDTEGPWWKLHPRAWATVEEADATTDGARLALLAQAVRKEAVYCGLRRWR